MYVGRVFYKRKSIPVIYSQSENCVYEIYGSIIDVLKLVEGEIEISSVPIPLNNVTILPPVIPSKIIAVGRNYVEHAKEFDNEIPQEPLIFFKPPSCIIPHFGKVLYPSISKRVDYEGELALVIKQTIKKVKASAIEAEPQEFFGYTAFLDMTARDLQHTDKLWTRAKGFDTFGPLGPWIELNALPKSLKIQTYVNGELKQEGNIDQMVFSPAKLIEYISGIMTLVPGDIIATGTPSGVGPVTVGDEIKVKIDTLADLIVTVTEN
ncbi:MAG: fumarylacetoacetate hydrolase family protein [Candidatus Heimdallarchaeaceae archaeon]